jgi:hypothetical protein
VAFGSASVLSLEVVRDQDNPGSTWERLAAIKRRYDPGNLFRLNQNLPPATEGSWRMTSLGTIRLISRGR